MKFFAKWGATPIDSQVAIENIEFGSIEFESTTLTLRLAKSKLFKEVKACPQVIDYFSSDGQDWDASESRWEDWQPEGLSMDRPDCKFTHRFSQDACVKKLGTVSCRIYIILSWQDLKQKAKDAVAPDPPPVEQELTQDAAADAVEGSAEADA